MPIKGIKSDRITGKPRNKMASNFRKKYDNGASIRSIAAASGRSYGFVHRVLVESGASMRGRGGFQKTKRNSR